MNPVFIILSQTKLQKVIYIARCQSLGPLDNTFTPDEEYSCHNKENLQLPIQMPLSKKPNAFLESTLNFEIFQKTKKNL